MPRPILHVSEEDMNLIQEFKTYRLENGLPGLIYDGYLQSLAETRTSWWVAMDIPKANLHYEFLGDAKYYTDHTPLIKIVELANKGYVNDLKAFLGSEPHRKAIMNEKLIKIGVSNVGKYCCVLLGY